MLSWVSGEVEGDEVWHRCAAYGAFSNQFDNGDGNRRQWGYRNQQQLEETIGEIHQDVKYAASIRVFASQDGKSFNEFVFDQAYTFR